MEHREPIVTHLRLPNSLSRSKQAFTSRDGRTVKIFTCGPSIYRRPHVGNYRTFLYEDILVRYLGYIGYDVERIINFTDVEDKSISEAKKEGSSVQDLVTPVIEKFTKESALLGIKLPAVIPRSSTSVDHAVKLIETLMEKGHAYRHTDGHIYFDPLSFEGFGRLFGLDMSRWPKTKKRFSKDTYPGQRWNLGDFILWHAWEGGETVYWDTEIGKGRPSWNVQDPAMIMKHLGPEIDIHCGGIDNIYRHHDYNIAVMEAATGSELAPFWLHGAHLIVNGTKMSKEKGNVVYPEHLLAKGYTGREIRFFLIYGYYRKKKNLTEENMGKTVEKLRRFRQSLAHVLDAPVPGTASTSSPLARQLVSSIEDAFRERMDDDLDVKGAFDSILRIVTRLESLRTAGRVSNEDVAVMKRHLEEVDTVLGCLFQN